MQQCVEALFQEFAESLIAAAPNNISYEGFRAAFCVWPEKIAMSPSGQNLSHYKALLIQDSEEEKAQTGERLLQAHYKMLKTTMESGVVPKHWKTCVSCAVEKDPGCPNISHLRIVHLYKADMNLFIKVIWGRKLVKHAESHGALGWDQFGSRPNKSCMDVVAKKMFTYTITRLT